LHQLTFVCRAVIVTDLFGDQGESRSGEKMSIKATKDFEMKK